MAGVPQYNIEKKIDEEEDEDEDSEYGDSKNVVEEDKDPIARKISS